MFPKLDVQMDQQFHEELRKSHALYSQAEQLGKLGHWEWDHVNQKMVSCSDQFAQIYEMTVDEAMAFFSNQGNEIGVVHPEDQERYKQQLIKSEEQLIGMDIKFRIITQSGKLRHIHQLSEKVLDDESRIITSFGTEQDITERMIAEEELHIMVEDLKELNAQLTKARDVEKESNRLRSDFFAVMSHEMRTPLNGVISALSLLQDPSHATDQQALTMLAQNSATSLLSVINYALDYSKIDAGRMTVENQDFNLPEVMKSVTDVTASRATQKELTIELEIDSEIPTYIHGDNEKLTQIMLNLVGNAIKFTEHGGVKVRISQHKMPDSLRFEVEDTGHGIPEDQLGMIFEPFWTSQKGSPSEPSTGLGLNICKQLVELLSGEISVDSTVGVGSCFTVTLPFFPATETTNTVVPSETRGEIPSRFLGNVMLVDDSQSNLLLGQMILEGMGVVVRTASTGEEAVEIAADIDFDLILMDIWLPGIDGVEATELIHQYGKSTPIVALTAHVGTGRKQEYLDKGFNGYLQKPVEKKQLIRTLSLWLKSAEAENA